MKWTHFCWNKVIPPECNYSIGMKLFYYNGIIKNQFLIGFFFQCRILNNSSRIESFHWNRITSQEQIYSTGMKLFHWNKISPLEWNNSIRVDLIKLSSQKFFFQKIFLLEQNLSTGMKSFYWNEIISLEQNNSTKMELYKFSSL